MSHCKSRYSAPSQKLRATVTSVLTVCMGCLFLSGCGVLPRNGPSTTAIINSGKENLSSVPVHVVDVDDVTTRRLAAIWKPSNFHETFGSVAPETEAVGNGDVLSISVWEAPPAVLFGIISGGTSESIGGVAQSTQFPEQTIDANGTISVPFAGTIQAAGRSTSAIARDIRARLLNKAHDPQVIVRRARNVTSDVTIVGEVNQSLRMPLTAGGERLLDALASAGGVKQPIDKMTIQITRGPDVVAMPLKSVINDPRENVTLRSNDVVTLLFQPFSFTVLGATGKNDEIPFESAGLTLSQAFGRMGGLADARASAEGVFIFRFENPKVFGETDKASPAVTADGKVPVIYRINMKDPRTFFVAQSFQIKDKDVIFVSTAPLADFSKFLQALSQVVYPIATIQNARIF